MLKDLVVIDFSPRLILTNDENLISNQVQQIQENRMSIGTGAEIARNRRMYTLAQALSKIHLIKARKRSGGIIIVPQVLVGKRIKLVIVEDKK